MLVSVLILIIIAVYLGEFIWTELNNWNEAVGPVKVVGIMAVCAVKMVTVQGRPPPGISRRYELAHGHRSEP